MLPEGKQSPLEINGTAAFGVRALRDLSKQRSQNSSNPLPGSSLERKEGGGSGSSRRQKQLRGSVTEYFLKHVDPILSSSIAFLLTAPPTEDVPAAMLSFLERREAEQGIQLTEEVYSRTKMEQKLYLANSISPVMSKLISRIALKRPENALKFLMDELVSMRTNRMLTVTNELEGASPEQALLSPSSKKKNSIREVMKRPSLNKAEEVEEIKRSIKVVVIGINGAGKSTLCNALQGDFTSKIRPTIGFRQITLAMDSNTTVHLYDVGGGAKIRDIWSHYYHDVHGIVYVLDSAASEEEMEVSRAAFTAALSHASLMGKPLLLLANKSESPSARDAEALRVLFGVHADNAQSSLVQCSASGTTLDERVDEGVDWLLRMILARFSELQSRVALDSAKKDNEEMLKRLSRERKVLKNKVASAFYAELSPELRSELTAVEAPKEGEIFSAEEGLAFLATEIGTAPGELGAEVNDLCAAVGYQCLALSLIGGLFCPVSKKKTPMSWAEIGTLVEGIRAELQLS